MSSLTKIAVLGSGLLGGQIAWHSAFKGKKVVVYDIAQESIDRCRAAHEQYGRIYRDELGATDAQLSSTTARLTYTTDLTQAVVDAELVIEAVPEVPQIKSDLYRQIAGIIPAETLIVTNSSTLLPSDFAADTGRPDKFCALHFGNGIWKMNFAEIMAHPTSSRETLTAVTQFAIEIGMVPIPVRKEQNGYVVNTWFVALTNAAQTLVTNGVATAEDVDRSFMIGGRAVGPMAMLDQVGLQLAYDVFGHWGTVNDDKQMSANAEFIKSNYLDKGLLGASSGQGYYSWPKASFMEPDFLAVPDVSEVPQIVALLSGDK
jgi:3-hydroxyacyl-CoA dehydrogenase